MRALDQQRLYDVTKWCADFNTFERKTFVKSRYDEEEIEKKNKLLMKRELETEKFRSGELFWWSYFDTRVDVLYWQKLKFLFIEEIFWSQISYAS